MANEIKHRGCSDCGSTDDPVLTSIPDYRTMTSKAVCSKCLQKSKYRRVIKQVNDASA
jgi:hypothetical protein